MSEAARPAGAAPPALSRLLNPLPHRASPRRVGLALTLLLAAFTVLCAHGLRWDTPTVDEFAHLPAGYYYLRTGNFALYNQNPPLIRVLSALPLLALDPPPAVDTAARLRNTGWYPWEFGTDFMARNRGRYDRIFLLGRLPIVALGLLAGLLVFAWARELYGDEAGLVALLGFAFCPTLIAHAHLATVDIGNATAILLALYLFQRCLRRPGPVALLACGAALGLAQLTKYTAILLYPLLLLLGAVALARGDGLVRLASAERSGPGRLRRAGWSAAALAAVFALSLVVLDAGYLFAGCGRPAAAFHFQSRLLRGVAGALPSWLPLPLPAAYLAGFDVIQLINDVGEFPSYLLGRWSRHGSIAYYPVALLVKTPLPLLAAWLAIALAGAAPAVRSIGGWLERGQGPARQPRGELGPARRVIREPTVPAAGALEYCLWLPAVILLAVFCLLSRVDYGVRYILPVLPLGMIATGRLVLWVRARGRAVRIAGLALLVCYPFSVLLTTPDTISYFNLLAGGRGDRVLLDSNLDWGQGLKRLRAYMDRKGIERMPLAYFGHVDPAIYGIRWQFPDPRRRGPVAVSANFLHGYPYATYAAGRIVPVPADAFSWIARHPRAADLGGGIYVYEVP